MTVLAGARAATRGRTVAAAAVALATVLAIAGAIYSVALHDAANYDEGVYLASLRDLQAGARLGSDVFASQPPGFYWLLRGAGAVAGSGVVDVRAVFLALALAGICAAWAIGRTLAGAAGGLGAAALLAVAPPYPTQATLVQADLVSAAIALAALAAAARSRRDAAALPAVAGLLFALAILVKLDAVTAAVPLAALALARRPTRRTVVAFAAGTALPFAVAALVHRHALGAIWEDAVSFHTSARDIPGPGVGDNVHRLVRFFDPHTPFGLLAPLGALVTLAAWLLRRPLGPGWLWTWTPAAGLFLALHRPLLDHHLVLLAVAAAPPAGAALAASAARLPRRAMLVAGAALTVVLAAGAVQEARRLDGNASSEPQEVRWAAERLRAETPPGSSVATDLPIVAVLADRLTPGELVDVSSVRLESGNLTRAAFVDEVRRAHPAAVVLGRELAGDRRVEQPLATLYPRREARGGVTVLLPAPAP